MNRRIRNPERLEQRLLLAADLGFRSFDGSGNNTDNDQWGAANSILLRFTTVDYGAGDAGDYPALAERVDSNGVTINPRTVSNLVFNQDASVLNDRELTSFVFQWGQFIDHDTGLTEDFVPVGAAKLDGEDISFPVPNDGTESELPLGTYIQQLRSRYQLDENGVAQQVNQITSYIDASNIYGSNPERAGNLRSFYGGMLLTSDGVSNLADGSGEYLPFNFEVDGEFLDNASPPSTGTGSPINPDDLFVSGDVRANEQPGLTALHTLFAKEHNYQARRIANELHLHSADLAQSEIDEHVYQLARAIVGAEIQSITYNEFLPAMLGPNQLESYSGYQEDVNAGIANEFSAAIYRVGHTMLPPDLLLLNEDGSPAPDNNDVLGAEVLDGTLPLGQAFFNPALITQYGIEPYLKGLAQQQIQEIDNLIVDGVRNLLFDPPTAVDLGAANLQRGRDHGLADYNQFRTDFGLAPVTSFEQISRDPAVAQALSLAYDGNVDNIDVFAAAISEDHLAGSSVGELVHTVLVDQFSRLRDGDRFFYQNSFHGKALKEIETTRLSKIIRRNTELDAIQEEVFRTDSVFTFRSEELKGNDDLTLRVRNDTLEILSRGRRVIASKPLSDTAIVVIYASDSKSKITIDSSVTEQFSGSIEVHGGDGDNRLVVEGTGSADDIEISKTEVRVDALSIFYGNFSRVTVLSGGGDDYVAVLENTNAALQLFGGAGNDIILGGGGNDWIFGGRGRDLLVGNDGRDRVFGNFDDDILVGELLSVERSELEAFRDVWTSSLSYSERVDLLITELVPTDDGERDFLLGGFGRDWLVG